MYKSMIAGLLLLVWFAPPSAAVTWPQIDVPYTAGSPTVDGNAG